MPSREMRSGDKPAISCPSKRMVPALGASSPESRLMSVVLPAPLGPMTAWSSPSLRSSMTSLTAASPPKCFESPVTRSTASDTARFQPPTPLAELAERPADAAGQDENGEDDEEPHRQEPVLAQLGQIILQQDEREGTEDRAIERAHAAQDHHHQHEPGLAPAEEVRIDGAELRRVEISRKPRQGAGDDEARELEAECREAQRAHARLIRLDAADDMAEGRA